MVIIMVIIIYHLHHHHHIELEMDAAFVMLLSQTDNSPSKFDKFEMLSGGKVEVIVKFGQSDTNILYLDGTPLKLTLG